MTAVVLDAIPQGTIERDDLDVTPLAAQLVAARRTVMAEILWYHARSAQSVQDFSSCLTSLLAQSGTGPVGELAGFIGRLLSPTDQGGRREDLIVLQRVQRMLSHILAECSWQLATDRLGSLGNDPRSAAPRRGVQRSSQSQ